MAEAGVSRLMKSVCRHDFYTVRFIISLRSIFVSLTYSCNVSLHECIASGSDKPNKNHHLENLH